MQTTIEQLQQENNELTLIAQNAIKNGSKALSLLAQHDKETLISFVSNVGETGQFGWSDCQWLTDYVEEYFEQLQRGEE